MQYPSFAEYSEALQNSLDTALSDPLLRRGTLRMHGPGQPIAHSGNFALTFEVAVDGRTYAVRCFHKHSDSLRARYHAIASHLQSIGNQYFVSFEFQPSGIRTESGTYPIVRMEWAQGPTLDAFVARHRNDVNALQQLRVSLRRLAAHLRQYGVAHGDIQPTNIIARSAVHLRLIDYDGMFVPKLAPLPSAELGQRNFQHPGRRSWHFDATLDAFAFSLTDLTLDALCRRPELWNLTGSDSDAFILRAADLADPASSPAFRLLATVPGLGPRVKHLAAICVSPFERIPSFEDFLAARNIPAVSVVFSGDVGLLLRRPYVSIYDIVDARNFARCCTHVGDRVELIGQVVRVVRNHAPQLDETCLRVEFAEQSHDMVCLKIWPDALAALETVPDATWAGQWVSAVGLVDPIYSAGDGPQRQKDVSITITEQSQLHRLTEAEARYRLRGYRGPARTLLDTTAGVRTDRVVTEPARPAQVLPPSEPAIEPASAATVLVQQVEPAAVEHAMQVRKPSDLASAPVDVDLPRPSPYKAREPPEERAPRMRGSGANAPGRQRYWPRWAAAGVIASVAVYVVVSVQNLQTQERPVKGASLPVPTAQDVAEAVPPASPASPTGHAVESTSAPDGTVSPAWQRAASRLMSQRKLGPNALPLATVAGRLELGAGRNTAGAHDLLLNGAAVQGLRDDRITLAHRTVFSDREVIVGYTRCEGATPPCGLDKPFWLELRAGLPPSVWRAPGLWAGGSGGLVATSDAGIRVDLGVWDGERRSATLTAAGSLDISRAREPKRPLSRADCAIVVQSADSCAASRDCSSFASSAQRIPPAARARLARLYHESTGLDAAAFRDLCVESCELGLTPSRAFIRRYVCNGAQSEQWSVNRPGIEIWQLQ